VVTTTKRGTVVEPAVLDDVRRVVEAVPDPELPVLTLGQLGVIRAVREEPVPGGSTHIVVDITPTYSGCPAMEVIAADVADAVRSMGLAVDVRLVLSPAWTTDWITVEGRKALQANGIAPPARPAGGPVRLDLGLHRAGPTCPQCGATDVEELARFGSTACKALWRCLSCREPFDYVKPL
jgi:ring-1,2-phenylacetyl-CoA epoxidase subunit PaaD